MYPVSNLVNLENFRFWDQIYPKTCDNKFWKNKH